MVEKILDCIGEIVVDTGNIVISDPCYIDDEEISVTIQTAYGDGVYPVYAEKDERGHIKRVLVDFAPWEQEAIK